MTWLLLPHRQVSRGARGEKLSSGERPLVSKWRCHEHSSHACVLAKDLWTWGLLNSVFNPVGSSSLLLFFHSRFRVSFVLWKGFWNNYSPHHKHYEIEEDNKNVFL